MIRFFKTHYVRKKKTIEKKSKKHAKLCGTKTEKILNSILEPVTAQPSLRINKTINFENKILSIFSMIHLFFKTHNVQQQKRAIENRENS